LHTAAELGSDEAVVVLEAMAIQEKAKSKNIDIGWVFAPKSVSKEYKRMPEFLELPLGTQMKVEVDLYNLRTLCNSRAPGAIDNEPVGWNDDMAVFAGKEAILVGLDADNKSYTLILPEEEWTDGNDDDDHDPKPFKFPFNTLQVHLVQ